MKLINKELKRFVFLFKFFNQSVKLPIGRIFARIKGI